MGFLPHRLGNGKFLDMALRPSFWKHLPTRLESSISSCMLRFRPPRGGSAFSPLYSHVSFSGVILCQDISLPSGWLAYSCIFF